MYNMEEEMGVKSWGVPGHCAPSHSDPVQENKYLAEHAERPAARRSLISIQASELRRPERGGIMGEHNGRPPANVSGRSAGPFYEAVNTILSATFTGEVYYSCSYRIYIV